MERWANMGLLEKISFIYIYIPIRNKNGGFAECAKWRITSQLGAIH